MVDPSLIHSDETVLKILFILSKMFQMLSRKSLVRMCFCSIVIEYGNHCARSFLKAKTSVEILLTLPNEIPRDSAKSLSVDRRSSKIISCIFVTISGVDALFQRPSRGSSQRLVRLCLNSATHLSTVPIESEEVIIWSDLKSMKIVTILFGAKIVTMLHLKSTIWNFEIGSL